MKAALVSLFMAGVLAYPEPGNAQIEQITEVGLATKRDKKVNNTRTPTEIPFDGGATLLLIAGAAYGVKKASSRLKNRRRQINNS